MHTTLLSLPFELQIAIFSYLDVNSIFVLSSLSHEFNNLAMCDSFYQTAIEKECILLKRCPDISRSDFVLYLQHHLGNASWKQLYKVLVVLPFLERRFLSMIDFNLLWKSHGDDQYLPRLIRLEMCIWMICSKFYALSSSVHDLEETIILGHHCFATLSQFFLLIIIKYCVPLLNSENPLCVDPTNFELIRGRVVAMLREWVSKNTHDILLNPPLCIAIRQFINFILAPHHKSQMEKTLQLISPTNVQKHIEHFSTTYNFMNSQSPNFRTEGAKIRTDESPSNLNNVNLDVSDVAEIPNPAGISNSAGISSFAEISNSSEISGENLLTISSAGEEEEGGEEDYEKRNINEVNFSNKSPFGNAGILRIPSMFSSSMDNCTLNILECDVEVVAQELAWFDWELYARVQISEVMDKSWRHVNKLIYSPNIVASIRWFNHVSFWVATEVLNFPKPKQRTQVLSTFMQIALKCYDLRDYHSVFSILAGLNMACIQRLHNSWSGMAKKLKDNFIRLSSFITGINGDFLAYKNILKTCELPAVPYLGCLLYDITFVLDTSENPKFPFIHLHKIAVMAKIVNEVARFQRVPYPCPVSLQYLGRLKNIKVLDAGELYRKSMELEPRRTSQTS
eukprot:Phypoly_transcript_05187.p1 GENE.Phypoly_transcript_05187~~Phypoly_transcript_05187.p1  ORF type:complete len:623 (+),score=68.40 Phypoly_transcript_05187:90-1958(+)